MNGVQKINWIANSLVLIITLLLGVYILTSVLETSTDINLVYGQPKQVNSSNAELLNVQNIPTKKVHVSDIDIGYKTFGRGDPFLLISGSGNATDAWEPSFLTDLSSNHKVIMFDNRGVRNTTIGDKSCSIQQFANDTASLLDALSIQKADVLGFSMGSFVARVCSFISRKN